MKGRGRRNLLLVVAAWGAGLVGALALIALLLVVRPDADRDAVVAAYRAPDSQFLSLPDGAIAHVRVDGPADAPPIVLLHGFASSSWAWDGWTAALKPNHRVIRIDLLGHGLTQMAPGAAAWRAQQEGFVLATLDALGVRTAVVAGNSMGGGIAWSLAANHPDRVAALILVDSAGPSPDGPPARVRRTLDAWYAPALRAAFRWGGGTILMRMSLRSGVADPGKITDADVRRTDLFWRLHRAELLAGFSALRSDPQPSLSTITAPTLVIQGGEDRLVPRAAADALVAGISGAQLKLYPGLGHTPHQEDSAATAADVRVFLKAVDGAGGQAGAAPSR